MKIRAFLLQLGLIAATAMALVGIDRLVGYLGPGHKLARQLFPPNSEVTVTTPEFTYTARINRSGFRGRELDATRATRLRMVAVGDSFTYGWGVAEGETWVSQLEHNLAATGLPVEIANLGKPAAGPAEYAAIAETAIATLEPDVVLVGLQQTDDLQQAVFDPAFLGLLKGIARASLATRVEGLFRRAFPNFALMLSSRVIENVKWGATVARVLELASDAERQRFKRLDEDIQQRFLDGALNPGLLVLALKSPRYYIELNDETELRMRERLNALVAQLGRVREAAARRGARVIVISVPNRAYVSEADVQNVARLGFATRPGLADWDFPDEVIQRAAESAGIPAVSVMESFRKVCRQSRCYFTLDDHLNAAGHRIFADYLGVVIRPLIEPR